jgi:bone morphogenetic protein 7
LISSSLLFFSAFAPSIAMLLGILMLLCLVQSSWPASFYADNGLQQTVIVDRLPRAQRRLVRQEVLQLLGLHHKPRPEPATKPTANSAPNFMLELYNLIEEDVDEPIFRQLPMQLYNVSAEERSADVIMSFVNHGQCLWNYGQF